jgi:hypothetical protein
MNVSLFTIQFLIQYINDEICESILKDDDGKSSGGKITLSIENSNNGIGLYMLNYDDINMSPEKMRIIRDFVNEVFYDLVQVDENAFSENASDSLPHSRARVPQ